MCFLESSERINISSTNESKFVNLLLERQISFKFDVIPQKSTY